MPQGALGKREAERPQNQFAAASLWKVWPGATLPVHDGLQWDGVIQTALGWILSTTVHHTPLLHTPPPLLSFASQKPNWVLAY